jgi:nucleoid DNA-binding protein
MVESPLTPAPIKQGIGRNNPLALVLVRQGCSYRAARKIVNLIFDEIKAALKRHEDVELPFGTFRVVETSQQPHRRWRFGQPQSVFKQRYRVVFEPRKGDAIGKS